MNRRSTASSSSERAAELATPDPGRPADPTRRQFFRAFGRQAVSSAGSVVGAAASLRRSGTAAAHELFGLGLGDPVANAARLAAPLIETETLEEAGFNSPYRFDGEGLLILDQRELPERTVVVACREPSEVASAIRQGVINGGPVLGPVAAYTLVLASLANASRPPDARRRAFAAAANTLRAARPAAQAINWAIGRLAGCYSGVNDDAQDAAQIHDLLRAEADALTSAAALGHAELGRLGAQALAGTGDRPISLLAHADMGPLSCGLVGTGMAVIQALTAAGREVHVWLTEAGPSREGARLSALQLSQAEVAHTVLPDSAVGWLFEHHTIDAVLLRADRVSASTDICAPIGSLNVALLARSAGVPVHACAPASAIDLLAADGAVLAAALPPPALVGDLLEPAADIVPASAIDSLFTETGVVARDDARALAAAAAPTAVGAS